MKVQNSRLSPAQQVSPNFYFDRLLLLQAYKISDKKVQRSYVSWYWRVMQNLKKNRFLVSKMTRIWWILIRALKSPKLVLWFVPFVQSIKHLTVKSTEELSLMTLKSHTKFKEELACGLENETRSLANFHQNIWKYQNCYFHGIILPKVENE